MSDANLLILDGPRYPSRRPNPVYRGTCRAVPRYFDNLPVDHEANELFLWFVEEGGELGVVHDHQKAIRLRNACNAQLPPGSFELVEVVEGDAKPVFGGEFLGFDLSQGFNNSMLWSGLTQRVPGEPELPVRVLANTVFRFFSRELNRNGLFATLETTAQCRKSLIALQAQEPNLLEGSPLEKFVAVGVFRLE
jgi:hypothetical protein